MGIILMVICTALAGNAVAETATPFIVQCVADDDGAAAASWQANWIWGPISPHGSTGFFRKQIHVRPGLRSAWGQMSGDDGYTLYVNGASVKQGGFWWNRTDRMDLTDLLHPGENLIGAHLGNAADPGAWLFELRLAYEDGSVDVIATDSSWRFSADAGEGWATVAFDDGDWSACVEMGSPPVAAPWGYLPYESLGDKGLVEMTRNTAPDIIEAGESVPGYIEIRPQSPITENARLQLTLKRDRDEIYRRAWKLEPAPSLWPKDQLVRIALPDEKLSPFLPPGTMELTYTLTDVVATNMDAGELVNKEVTVHNNSEFPLTKTAVQPHNGMPALFIDDQPTFSLWFWQREILAQDAHAFRDAGVDVFTFCSPVYYLDPGWVAEDTYDYSEFDGIMLRFLEKAPDAYAMPRIFVAAPEWWIDKYPEEACGYATGVGWQQNGWGGTKHESFASRRWQQDAGEALRRFVRHIEAAPYGGRIIGMHVSNGIYGEWHTWSATDIPDTSEPMRQAMAAHVRDKYQDDVALLRRSWGDPDVTFDTVAVPTLEERHAGDIGMFRDPAASRKVADYYESLHRVTVEAIDHFCGIVKRESAGRLFTCVFYSYAPDLDWPQEGDHRAAALAHRLDSVDVFSSPHSYSRRKLGDDGLFRNYPAALALHGKLFVDEADDRTHLANDPDFTHVATLEESIEVVRRQFGNAVTRGTGLWYMDQQNSWFHDDAIMAEIARLKSWGDASLEMPRHSVAEVAVISALESEFYLAGRDSGKNHVTYALYDAQIGELCRSGAPFNWYLIEDLVEGLIPPHKVYIFLDAFYLSSEQRAAVEKLKQNNHTLVFFYAPGYILPDALSLGEMARLTGMTFEQRERGMLRITLDEGLFPAGPHSYGPGAEQAPVFAPTDNSGAVWGHYADSQRPGLLVKDLDAWRSVYSGVPGLPAAVLRRIFTDAGVHIYCDTDDNISVNAGWLMVHAASPGAKTIHLPHPATVHDIIRDKPLGEGLQQIVVDLNTGGTALYTLTAP